MIRRVGWLALAALFWHGCGDDRPSSTSPTPTQSVTLLQVAPTKLIVVSGETQEVVDGAQIRVDGESFVTDDSGRATVGVLSLGKNVDILAEGYLQRQTLFRGEGETRMTLWPSTSPLGLTPELTRRLVYTGWQRDAVLGELPLRRPPLGRVIEVSVDPDIAGDPRVGRVVEDAVDAVRAALQGRLEIVTTRSRSPRRVTWHVYVDPDAVDSEFIAITRWVRDGQELVGAELAFRTLSDVIDDERLLTHMMGTAFGLRSSADVNDRMYFDWWSRRPNDFSPKEGLVMRLMLERPAGNRWPDNDRSLGASPLSLQPIQYLRPPR
jgi:hypothetical protein